MTATDRSQLMSRILQRTARMLELAADGDWTASAGLLGERDADLRSLLAQPPAGAARRDTIDLLRRVRDSHEHLLQAALRAQQACVTEARALQKSRHAASAYAGR